MSGLLRISNRLRPWLLRLDRASISTGNGGLYNKIAVVKRPKYIQNIMGGARINFILT